MMLPTHYGRNKLFASLGEAGATGLKATVKERYFHTNMQAFYAIIDYRDLMKCGRRK